ncbi:MAG: alpha/beta hydrolase [Lactobacillus sp.]|uniref:alpha/beta hydrolase n=1 Tax=Limosilactobacillus coleohominis TaxID=181675 RepID=UPI00195B3A4F|nr:alpha/beta hydrolase [Limosilactobacillus coleohominis]MBM6955225.1 alpha/beta hydrolase [Limosilactobacillus coleohominis]MCI5813169.1 alpha/beta hydrolase [Lactobacillus sp.]MDY5628467.1 alpha/beta hydrolase [Limosilactobacillus coleohominis]
MTIHEINNNAAMKGQVRLIENVTYSAVDGEALKMDILAPWSQRYDYLKSDPRPLIVFVQGSSWRQPTMGEEIPQLVQFVKAGYIVATVQHRNSLDGHSFPAFLQDVKTAIRFLRAHAEQYAIDPQRVAIWGTSSGANASLLVALTPNDSRYKTAEYADQSDAVNAVVSCFAPTDVVDTFKNASQVPGSDILQYSLFGTDPSKWDDIKRQMSPLYQIKDGQKYPPFLLLHGDADKVVPYHQMEDMYHALEEHGVSVEAYRVKGANHERDFWSQTIYDIVKDFLAPIEKPVVE